MAKTGAARGLIFFVLVAMGIFYPRSAEAGFFGRHTQTKTQSREKKSNPQGHGYSEKENYLVVFRLTGESRKDQGEGGKTWNELGYKLVSLANDPSELFGPSGWVEVRFRDKDGYTVTADKVPDKNMTTHQEYYGFIWVEAQKAGSIMEAEVRPLKQDEIPALPVPEPEPTPSPEPTPLPSVSPSPEPTPVPSPTSEPSAGAVPSPVPQSSPTPSPEPSPSVSPSPQAPPAPEASSPSPTPMAAASGTPENGEKKMTTEDDIRSELKTAETKPQTQVEFPPLPGGSPEPEQAQGRTNSNT